MKKDISWTWLDTEQIAFDQLKVAITGVPVLILPNFNEEFCVETDACGQGRGVVLQQKGRPVAFFSKGLGVKHQTLSIYDKEMLAVLLAVKKWHPYLIRKHFSIKTDHQSLKFLANK